MAVGLLGKASSSSVAEFNANPPAGDRAAEIVIGSIPVPTRCDVKKPEYQKSGSSEHDSRPSATGKTIPLDQSPVQSPTK